MHPTHPTTGEDSLSVLAYEASSTAEDIPFLYECVTQQQLQPQAQPGPLHQQIHKRHSSLRQAAQAGGPPWQ